MKKLAFILLCILFSLSLYGLLPLKISDDRKYIVTEDNQPFFWLGCTAWEMIHRLTREEVDYYLIDRFTKGFTVIQTVILAEFNGLNTPNAYGQKPLLNNDPAQINDTYFKMVDYVIQKAGELNMYIGLLPTWGDKFNKAWGEGPEIFTPENARIYGEILARRYSDKPNIIWILGGDRWPEDDEDRAIINAMAEGIRNYDASHLITFHPNAPNMASDFFNAAWLDFDMFQTGHDRTVKDYEFVWKSSRVMPVRPVVNGEPRYEDHPDRFNSELYGWLDDADVRSSAYWTMLSGAAGYTYGNHNIWQMYSTERTPVNGARTSWQNALDLPGARQMQYLKNLIVSFPWQQMENDQSVILNENVPESSFMVASVGLSKDFMLIYTPLGNSVIPDLTKLNAQRVQAFWFNPRDGKLTSIGEYAITERPEFKPWSQGRGSDFVLVVMDKNARYQLPRIVMVPALIKL